MERKAYPLPVICDVLSVSISGYRTWKRGGSPTRRRLSDAQMLALIRAIAKELKNAYGSPRITKECGTGAFQRASPASNG